MNINKNAAPRENTIHGKACWQVCVWCCTAVFLSLSPSEIVSPWSFSLMTPQSWVLREMGSQTDVMAGLTSFCVSVRKPGRREGEGSFSISFSKHDFWESEMWKSIPRFVYMPLIFNSYLPPSLCFIVTVLLNFYPCILGKIHPISWLFTMTHGMVGRELGCKWGHLTMILKRPFFSGSWFCHS